MRELDVESGGPIWDLVAEFLERRERGESIDAESFIRSHLDVADRLRDALAGFQWLEAKGKSGSAAMGEVLPRSFGNYELLRVVGRGGMGCVYEAFHRPLKRHVAVKVLPPHLTNVREFRLRFLREARVIASLHHTHIAPVFEVGQIGDTLYLAMPFIDGPNLRELATPLPDDQPVITKALRARLPKPFSPAYWRWVADIGVQAAEALAHAHERGVIHRDVKPSNLLLDEHGQIWIVDFGLAKAPTHPTVTQPGELIGTLRYASPEQVRGDPFDRRTDIYSLGVTLYEVLTRRPAFPPGQVVSAPSPRRVNPRIPRDLEIIIVRAMDRSPADRYATADAMADDLRRFLRDEPIRARPIGWIGRLMRWSRRNPAVTGVAAAAAMLLASFTVFLLFREAVHREARDIEKGISRARYASYMQVSAAYTAESGQPGRTRRALEMIREAATIDFQDDLWELAIRAIDQVDVSATIDLDNADGPIHHLAVSPDGKEIAGVEPSGAMRFWSAAGGESWAVKGFGEPLGSIVWSPDSTRILAVSSKHVWLARVDRAARALDEIRVISYQPAAVTFHPSGRQIAVWGTNLGLWDLGAGQFVWERPSGNSESAYGPVRFSPDGNYLAAVPEGEATIEFWSMPDGERLPPIGVVFDEVNSRMRGPPLSDIAFTLDSLQIAGACADGSIRFFDFKTGALERTLHGHETPVRWLAFFSPTASARIGTGWLVSADEQDVRLWDTSRNQQLAVLARNLDGQRAASIDPRGSTLAVADGAATPRAWVMPNMLRHLVIGPEPQRVTCIAASPLDRRIAWGNEQGRVVVGDADLRIPRVELSTELQNVQMAFGAGGKVLAMAGEGDPPIRVYSIETGELRPLAAGRSAVRAIAFVSAGQRLAAVHADGRLVLWNLDDGKPFATVDCGQLSSLASSMDGSWLAAGGANGELHLWNTATMSTMSASAAHASEVLALAFSGDSQSLASASRDGLVCRWRVANLKRELRSEGPGGPVRSLAFCLDDSTLAMCAGDGRVYLWASNRPARIAALVGRSTGRFDALTSTFEGRTIVAAGGPKQTTVSAPGSLELWDVAALHRAVLDAQLPDWRAGNTARSSRVETTP